MFPIGNIHPPGAPATRQPPQPQSQGRRVRTIRAQAKCSRSGTFPHPARLQPANLRSRRAKGDDSEPSGAVCVNCLEALGGRLEDVVRTRIHVRDASRWEPVARVHGRYFEGIRPVNTLVEVGRLVGEFEVEIEAEAQVGAG
jgi:hypothetical protein